MVPPLELLRLPLSTELPYLNIPLFCFDSEFVPFVCLFFSHFAKYCLFLTKGAALAERRLTTGTLLEQTNRQTVNYVHFVEKLQTFDLRALGGSLCRKFGWGAVYTFL